MGQLREQEHSRSLLRAAARANLAKETSRKRADLLQKCLAGGNEALAELLRQPEEEEEAQAAVVIDQIESDFPARLQHRKEQYDALLDDFQRQIEKKRQEYNGINKRLKETNASYYS